MHVLVTGASSGIGRDLAKVFATTGNKLSLVARRAALLDELGRELSVPYQTIAADLANDATGWIARAEEKLGPIDVLINNAGISYIEPVDGIDEERVRALYQINVHTPIAAVRRVLPTMRVRGSGTIVNVASVAAFTASPFMCDYHATKGAFGNFSESLFMELRGTGIHVVTVYPGPIKTPMAERNYGQFKDEAAARRAPTGDPATLARLVHDAVTRKRARVIYPSFYRFAWWLPAIARSLSAKLVPQATGAITPPMPGDTHQAKLDQHR